MTPDVLPWIVALVAIALGAGYVLGHKSARRAMPTAATPSGQPAAPGASSRSAEPASAPAPRAASAAADGGPAGLLQGVRSWAYQLQRLNVAKAAESPYDLLVIDYSKDGSDETALTPAEIERLKRKPDGSRRLVVAYVSIGEAESYRFYWNSAWMRAKPDWLLGENPDWDENYSVCFWAPEWQALIFGTPASYVDKVIAQGFDGIFLDKCDVTEDLREHFKAMARSRPDLDGDMAAFVERLSAYVKAKRPGFIVLMQNAEPLLERPELRAALDGMGKEELLYGLDAAERPNTKGEIAWSRDLLNLMQNEGKPVFCVEYLDNPVKVRDAVLEMKRFGYILYVSGKDRELARLVPPPAAA